MHGRPRPRAALAAAAAMELLHSSPLVHDDIMDNDLPAPRLGHGLCPVREARAGSMAAAFGRSMGICAGDVGFFAAWDILSRLAVEPAARPGVLGFYCRV